MIHRASGIVLFVAVSVAAFLVGCGDDPGTKDRASKRAPATGHEGHDHGPGESHGDHDGHDHSGHDHGDHKPGGHDDHDHAEHSDQVTLTAEAIQRWGVRTEPLARHQLIQTLSVPARVSFDAERIAHVGSAVSGRVAQIKARIGDQVKAGDVLLVVVSPELGEAQSEYLRRRSAIAAAEAAVRVAKSIYEQAKALYDQSRGIALSEVQRREAELLAAEGELAAARGQVKAAENTLHMLGMTPPAVASLGDTGEIDPHYAIGSPIDGQVIAREATLGESVGPDRDALLVVADLGTLWVIADVPESQIGLVRIGSTADLTVPAFPGRDFSGPVTNLGAALNAATRTVPVRIEVAGAAGLLRPGMFAEVRIKSGDPSQAAVLAIPEVAVQSVEGETCVFIPVAGEANTFAKRVVRVGPPVGRMVPLLDGLREGDAYVAHGSFILKADLGKAGAAHEH